MYGWVRVDCARCGSVELPASEVRLVMAGPDTDRGAGDTDARDLVEFRCRACGLAGSVRLDERAARLVAAAGASPAVPEPGPMPRRPGPGPGRLGS